MTGDMKAVCISVYISLEEGWGNLGVDSLIIWDIRDCSQHSSRSSVSWGQGKYQEISSCLLHEATLTVRCAAITIDLGRSGHSTFILPSLS